MTYPPQGSYPNDPSHSGYGQPGYPPPPGPAYPGSPAGYPPPPGPAYPGSPAYPASGPGYPASGPGYPSSGAGYPASGPGYPGSAPGYPATQPGYPGQPGQPGYPPSQPGYPPAPGGYPDPYQSQYPATGGGRPPRPTTVTIACGLLLLITVLSVFGHAASIAAYNSMEDNLRDYLAEQGLPTATADNIGGSGFRYFSVGFGMLISLGIGVLALFNLRGSNGARITTWILLGISVALGLCGLIALGTSSAALNSLSSIADTEEIIDRIYPSWYFPLAWAQSIISMIIYVTVIILLAMPSSNAFFKRR